MAKKTHEQLAEVFVNRFEEYNTLMLKEIAETIKQFKGLSYTEAHRLGQQLRYNKRYNDLVNELAILSNRTKKDVKDLLVQTAKENAEFSSIYYKARGMDAPIYENNPRLQTIANSVANISNDEFNNLSGTTAYRFVDETGKLTYLNPKDTFNKVLDDSIYAVSTGQDTFDNVMRNVINQLADSGIRKVYYDNEGKVAYSQRLDTVVRRNILDSIRSINIETQKELGEKFGADGMEITVHDNPAEDHAEMQGRQFSIKEFNKLMSTGKATDYKGKPIDIRRPRKKGGFFFRPVSEYNCYHTAFAIILGVSDPLYSEEELEDIQERSSTKIEIDGREYTRYEATQLQRRIETEIRKSKDAHMMYRTTDDKVGILQEQKRISELTNKYKEISKKTNIREQLNRARVSGYRRIKVRNEKEIEYARENNKIYHTTAYTDEIIRSGKLKPSSIAVSKHISEKVQYGTQYIIFKPEILSEITKNDILFKGDGGVIEQNRNRFSSLMAMLKNDPKFYNELKTKHNIDIVNYIDYIKLRDDEPKELYKLLEDNKIKYRTYKSERIDIFRQDRNRSKK